MQADIRAPGFSLTPSIRRSIERAAAFDLGRFADRIAHLTVHVFDIDASRGGAAKACRVHVRLRRGPELVVLDVQDDFYTAIGSAFARVGYAMRRQLDRYARRSRESIPYMPGGLAA